MLSNKESVDEVLEAESAFVLVQSGVVLILSDLLDTQSLLLLIY